MEFLVNREGKTPWGIQQRKLAFLSAGVDGCQNWRGVEGFKQVNGWLGQRLGQSRLETAGVAS
jgi:hypothetical protein